MVQRCLSGVVRRPEDIRTDASDRTDIDYGAASANDHLMEVVHHAHGPKYVHRKHLFHLPDIRIGRGHGIACAGIMRRDDQSSEVVRER